MDFGLPTRGHYFVHINVHINTDVSSENAIQEIRSSLYDVIVPSNLRACTDFPFSLHAVVCCENGGDFEVISDTMDTFNVVAPRFLDKLYAALGDFRSSASSFSN